MKEKKNILKTDIWKVRTYSKGYLVFSHENGAICRCLTPNDAKWIAYRLNIANNYENTMCEMIELLHENVDLTYSHDYHGLSLSRIIKTIKKIKKMIENILKESIWI